MSFKVDGYHANKEHISLNQIGIFGHKLIPERKNAPIRYCVTRLVRNRDETEINFESNSVIQNEMPFAIRLVAFDQDGRDI
jgi:hypothetical protein